MSTHGISEKHGNLADVPLTPTPEKPDTLAEPSAPRVSGPHNVDETYARYERAPFRRYSLLPGNGNKNNNVRRQPSKASSLINWLLQRQDKLESKVDSGRVDDDRGRGRPRRRNESYTLAGPRYEESESEDEGSADLGYENGQTSRPKPKFGLGQPFPQENRNRWSKKSKGKKKNRAAGRQPKETQHGTRVEEPSASGKPQGQVGGGPGGHHGSPVRGRPMGETSGGPAGHGRNPDDEDAAGNSNWVEELADGINDYSATGRHDSEQTLTESSDNGDEEQVPNYWFAIRRKIREPLAEWLGTMVAVLIGVSGNLQVKTSNGKDGSYTQSAACWGLGTMMAIYIAGGVSGAHCNPMVSIMLSVFRGFPMRKVFIYVCAQILGAICAVWIAYGIYKDAILNYDPGKTSTTSGTGTSFFTLPQPFATPVTAFFTDFTSAAVMSGTVLAMGDDTNSPPGAGMHAFIIGIVGFATAATLGYNTGPQTNPAKDLATRLVPSVVGYGSEMWAQGWWAEAWCASIFGGLAGCLIYDVAIFEGPESPVNYPRVKRKKARQGTKGKWHLTGMFGKEKKQQAKKDLEAGNIGVMDRTMERRLDGH